MSSLKSLFKFNPAEDDQVDPEYELISNPCWTVQDASAYSGGYAVNEHAPAGTPDKDFWMKEHGAYRTLQAAMAECVRRASA